MKARLLTDGRYGFMQGMDYPLEVECELSEMGNVACTPEQLIEAGAKNVPDRFCSEVWYWTIPEEAFIMIDEPLWKE